MLRYASAALIFAALAGSALAQAETQPSTVPEELQGMLGPWNLEQEDPSLAKCALNLTDAQVAGGWTVEVPDPCPAPYPAADAIAVWNIDPNDGSVTLLDSTGKVTLRLFEDEDGLYDTDPETTPRFYLLPPYDEDDSGGESDGD
jgi:hypothetical protein